MLGLQVDGAEGVKRLGSFSLSITKLAIRREAPLNQSNYRPQEGDFMFKQLGLR